MSHLHSSHLFLHTSKIFQQLQQSNNNTQFEITPQSITFWLMLPYMVKQYRENLKDAYPACQNSSDPSEPPLANKPSWTGCQATAATKKEKMYMHTTYKYTTHCFTCRRLIHILIRIIPVASFLCPLKTCSSSLRLRMSNSLHKWSRDAVNSQLPLRFHFTSMTVFLCACLRTKHNTRHKINSPS